MRVRSIFATTRSLLNRGSVEIKEYLHYLLTSKGVASSAANQAYSALKFLSQYARKAMEFTSILERAGRRYCRSLNEMIDATSRQHVRKTPNHSEMTIRRLRVSEATRLRVVDIDSKRMQICVQQAKGLGRYSVLSREVLGLLREY